MGQLTVGSVTLVNFPFADLKGYKKRPALVVVLGSQNTVILCQITSQNTSTTPRIQLTKSDFQTGDLPITSFVRPDKLFTVDVSTAEKAVLGKIRDERLAEVKEAIRQLFN